MVLFQLSEYTKEFDIVHNICIDAIVMQEGVIHISMTIAPQDYGIQ